jgi:hypothetical protein
VGHAVRRMSSRLLQLCRTCAGSLRSLFDRHQQLIRVLPSRCRQSRLAAPEARGRAIGPFRGREPSASPPGISDFRNRIGTKRSFGDVRAMVAIEVPAQTVDATQALNRSAGVRKPKVLRGRLLSCRATLLSCACVYTDRSVPLGKYCRSRPLVFSLDPRC